jgi:serine/threonine protein kinase, bacterial
MPLRDGSVFAGYTVIRLLGSGGMGEVYLAQHPRLPRRDALKLLPPEWSADQEYRTRFKREADLASTLWHPHIVGVHDRGETDGQLWISMDFVDGLDASRLLAHRYPAGMPVEEVLRIVTAVAGGLDYAHKQGLLHRDVKPANIMLTHLDDDGEQRILLTDFGIARSVDDISGLTATNMTVGTVAYSAPEQLMGEEVDGRADQYALAATAYHLLTGSQLFPHSNPAVVISRHLNAPPPAIASTRPDIAGLDSVLAVALAKDPEKRFARCVDFARALGENTTMVSAPSPLAVTMSAPVPRGPRPTPGQSIPEWRPAPPAAPINSRRRWLILAAVVSVALLACAIVLIWQPWRKEPPSATSQPPPSASTSPAQSAAPPPVPPPPLTATTTTVPARTPEPGLVNNANDPCSWCDTPNVKFFQSPSGNISCEIDYKRGYGMSDTAYCLSLKPLQNVSMNSDGVLTVCTGESCGSNPPEGEPTLPYNHTTGIGPFTCLSAVSGLTCTVVSGRGFTISNSGITAVG